MPYVQITLSKGRSSEELTALMAGVAQAVHQALDTPLSGVRVWLTEIDEAHISVGGVPLPEVRARRESGDGSL